MDNIKKQFDLTKKLYDKGCSPLAEVAETVQICLNKLQPLATRAYGVCSSKPYSIFEVDGQKSRPILTSLLNTDRDVFRRNWNRLVASASGISHRFEISEAEANATLYTAIMSFAACYDIWKPKSRKTPGTFFEIVLGSLISQILPEGKRTKFIPLPPPPKKIQALLASDMQEICPQDDAVDSEETDTDSAGSVSTDIVFNLPGDIGIVIPAKITTRERIVQPFAHQRILDSAMGEGRYISLLTCVSETQRDDKKESVNEICVPGTIALFQEHLAKLGGIYYLDPPRRYLQLSEAGEIEVASVGALLVGKFGALINKLQTNLPAA